MKELDDVHYPKAKQLHVLLDNSLSIDQAHSTKVTWHQEPDESWIPSPFITRLSLLVG